MEVAQYCQSKVMFALSDLFLSLSAGIVRTAVPDMDREAQAQYQVVLQARDMGGHQGGLTGTTTLTVHLSDVNDNPPRFTQSESNIQTCSRTHQKPSLI